MQKMASKAHLNEKDWNRTIFIDTTGIGTTDFDLTQKKINKLIENGRIDIDTYFEWQNSESIKKPWLS